jgi:hypothetical protein
MSSQRAEAEVMCRLARYFRDNPLACDTAEGARRWWLPQREDIGESMVTAAFESLVGRCILETLPAVDGRIRYRLIDGDDARAALERIARESPPRPDPDGEQCK